MLDAASCGTIELHVAVPSCGLPSFLLPVSPTEEVTCDHRTAELVSGRCLPIPIGLPVVSGDKLDRTVVPDSVVREDNC